MDREGFSIVDAQYQKDIEAATLKLNEDLDQKYLTKSRDFVPREMQRSGRLADNHNRQIEFDQRLSEIKQRFSFSHFPGIGREQTLLDLEKEEKKLEYERAMKEHFNKRSALERNDEMER